MMVSEKIKELADIIDALSKKYCEKIKELADIIDALSKKYCENCQQYDCDMCPYLMEEDNG